jgi:hypothetical protein
MEISIPPDAEMLAKTQAAAAGFTSIDDYVANLIRRQRGRESNGSRELAFRELRRLRQELPKLSAAEIVRSVHEARTDLS